ncbi:hypothetical protein A0J61_03351 [Choanephora cucurbitarum]|uniref:Uncharacterized protein n=1 Tax=Choanephora cucurbitarum TaxID=101091 RepID=A0A1C7NHY5_9FUNG|nr:hypothetical protein A0J61_03351 [Choanephora cucurbitarum]
MILPSYVVQISPLSFISFDNPNPDVFSIWPYRTEINSRDKHEFNRDHASVNLNTRTRVSYSSHSDEDDKQMVHQRRPRPQNPRPPSSPPMPVTTLSTD